MPKEFRRLWRLYLSILAVSIFVNETDQSMTDESSVPWSFSTLVKSLASWTVMSFEDAELP